MQRAQGDISPTTVTVAYISFLISFKVYVLIYSRERGRKGVIKGLNKAQ